MVAATPRHPNLLVGMMNATAGNASIVCTSLAVAFCGRLCHAATEDERATVRDALDSAAIWLGAGRPAEALSALEPVERIEPDNPWLWYYRGAALVLQHDPYPAMESCDRAAALLAASGYDDAQLSAAIQQQRAKARQQVFSVTVGLGLAYDSNVSFLGGGASQLGFVTGRGDGKFGSQVRLDFAPIATPRQTVALGLRLGHSWHFSIEQFDYQDYGAYLRWVRRLDPHWSAELRYDYDIEYLGNDSYLSNHVVTPMLSYHWDAGPDRFRPTESTLFYNLEGRDFLFQTDPDLDQDGFVNAVGVEQNFLLRPVAQWDWTWELGAGYRFAAVSTEGSEFDRLTHDFHASLSMPLVDPSSPGQYLILPDKRLDFRFDALWQIADYRNASVYDRDGDQRSDLISVLSFVLSQTLIDDPRRGALILNGIVNWTDAQSNVTMRDRSTPFSYDKVVYGIQLEWSW